MAHPPRIDLTLFFVRHGQTEWNRRGLLQGQGGFGLLPEGFQDAERAAAGLAGKGVRIVYSSDLQRAVQTAQVLRERLALPRVRLSKALREMHYGRMSGRPEPEVRRLCPLFRKDARYVFPEGESFLAVQARAYRWLGGLLRRHSSGTFAVVTHGGWLRTLFAGLKGVPLNRCLMGTVCHGLAGRLEVSRGRGLHLTVERGVTIFPGR